MVLTSLSEPQPPDGIVGSLVLLSVPMGAPIHRDGGIMAHEAAPVCSQAHMRQRRSHHQW
jgi:hypothetical protein